MVTNLLHTAYKWQDRYYQLSNETIFNISKTLPKCPDNCFYLVSEIASSTNNQTQSNPRVLGSCAPRLCYSASIFKNGSVFNDCYQEASLQHLIEEGDKLHVTEGSKYEGNADLTTPKAVFEQRHPEAAVFNNSYYEKWLRMDVCNYIIPMVNAGQSASKIWENIPFWLKRPDSEDNAWEYFTVVDKRGKRLKKTDINRILSGEDGLEFEYTISHEEISNNTWNLTENDLLVEEGLHFKYYECEEDNGVEYAVPHWISVGFTYSEFYTNIYLPIKRGEIASLASTWIYDQGLKPNADAIDVINADASLVELEPTELAGKPEQYVLAPIVEKVGEPTEHTISVINENGEVEERTIMVQKINTSIVIGSAGVVNHHDAGFAVKEVNLVEQTPSEPANH